MPILTGKKLEEFKSRLERELNEQLDELDKKYRYVDETIKPDNTALQAAILLHLRQEREEKLRMLLEQQAKDTWDNMSASERYRDAAHSIYTQTEYPQETDHYILNSTQELCDLLYKK